MKGFARKVVFSAATLFLLLAFVTPVISANRSTDAYSFANASPAPPAPPDSTETTTAEEPVAIEVEEVPEEPEIPPAPEEGASDGTAEAGDISLDMPQEEDPMASPDESCLSKGQGKSNGHAYGYLRNLEKKI